MRDVRFVVVHHPGPKWKQGVAPFEQEGLQAHVEHFRQWLAQGKLAMGGPFLSAGSVGMMIPEPGVARDEVASFAAEDPAVASGLLTFEVRDWMVGMKK